MRWRLETDLSITLLCVAPARQHERGLLQVLILCRRSIQARPLSQAAASRCSGTGAALRSQGGDSTGTDPAYSAAAAPPFFNPGRFAIGLGVLPGVAVPPEAVLAFSSSAFERLPLVASASSRCSAVCEAAINGPCAAPARQHE